MKKTRNFGDPDNLPQPKIVPPEIDSRLHVGQMELPPDFDDSEPVGHSTQLAPDSGIKESISETAESPDIPKPGPGIV